MRCCTLDRVVPGARLLTPEAVALDLPTAGAGPRTLCTAFDVVVSVSTVYLVLFAVAVAGGWAG